MLVIISRDPFATAQIKSALIGFLNFQSIILIYVKPHSLLLRAKKNTGTNASGLCVI